VFVLVAMGCGPGDGGGDAGDVQGDPFADGLPEGMQEAGPDAQQVPCQSDDDCEALAPPECHKAFCDVSSGFCAAAPGPDNVGCKTGSLCETDGMCRNGACKGTPVACDDGNPCTDDGCDPASGCTHVPNTAPCDDGNPCTELDACLDSKCVGKPNQCPCKVVASRN
jgi:hypothetical protein